MDSNHRPPGYEPGQLPLLTLRDFAIHHFKEQARLLSEIEATSVTEDWKFGINRSEILLGLLWITKQQTNSPLTLVIRNKRHF